MKKFRLILASASFFVLLFCSTGAFAQSANYGLVKSAVGDALEASNYDLVEKTEAIGRLKALKKSVYLSSVVDLESELIKGVKYDIVKTLLKDMHYSGVSTEETIYNSVENISNAINLFDSDSNSGIVEQALLEIVAELEN
jgi:hypothetical protein